MKKLSAREMQILNCLVKGCTNNEIADKLSVSKDTVKAYLKQIYEKLEVSNRVCAAVKAVSLNIVKTSEI